MVQAAALRSDESRPLHSNDNRPKYGVTIPNNKKRALGQYFTKEAAWLNPLILSFIEHHGTVVDPFAGGGDILKLFPDTLGYDVDPTLDWSLNDSLRHIPQGRRGDICITNPPYLAKNSACRRGMADAYRYFGEHPGYEDLYQIALHQCLASFDRVVAIVPETFLTTAHFKDRLVFVNIIEAELFADTTCPVLVAAWGREATPDFTVYKNGKLVGSWSGITATLPPLVAEPVSMRFNDPHGELGIDCIDRLRGKTIRFCRGDDIASDRVEHTGRSVTRVSLGIEVTDDLIDACNAILDRLRQASADCLLSPFKGNMRSGERRRRLDYTLARRIVNSACLCSEGVEAFYGEAA